MDPDTEATIARVYSGFQNRKYPVVKPKVIPFGNKTINDYIKKPRAIDYKRRVSDDGLRKIAIRGFDQSYADSLHPECFKKYVEFCDKYNISNNTYDYDDDDDDDDDYDSGLTIKVVVAQTIVKEVLTPNIIARIIVVGGHGNK